MTPTNRTMTVVEYVDSTSPQTTVFPDPTTEQVRTALADLSARVRRIHRIDFHAADGSSLTVDGSGGLFFSLFTRGDCAMFECYDPGQPDESTTVMCGGVWSDLPRRHLLEQPAILRVISDFLEGRLDTSVGWEPL